MNARSKIDDAFLAKELTRLIRFNTVSSRSNAACAAYVARALRTFGFRVQLQKKRIDGHLFINVIGTKGTGSRPVLLCSHIDTVPPGNHRDWTRTRGKPWHANVQGGSLYGLGSADDKGPLLAMLCAALRTKHHQLKRPLMMMGTFGEECGMPGAIHCVEHWRGPKPCCAIVGEPTSLGITYRHKGLGVIEIELKKKNIKSVQTVMRQTKRSVTFRGKQGHSSRPHLGDNALDKLMHFLGQRVKRNRRIRVLSIHGGSAANLIPGSASLEFQRDHDDNELSLALVDCYQEVQKIVKRLSRRVDRSFYPSTITSNFGVARTKGDVTKLVFDFRLLPGQSIRSIYRELDKCLKKRLRLYPTLTWRAYVERANLPLGQDRKYPFVKAGTKLLKQERLPLALSVKPSCTEAGVYAQWGVPSFVFGPGRSSGNIHAPNESIRISEIKRAIKFYTRAIQTFCVEGKPCS